MMKFDMHCHTKAGSIDASVSVERYIELLSAQGFDGMLVTDHDSYKGYHKWMRQKGRSFWSIEQIEEKLEKTFHPEVDSIRIYRLGNSYQNKIDVMGKCAPVEAGEALLF